MRKKVERVKFADLPQSIPIFGDTGFRGDCNSEFIEQMEFFDWLKLHHEHHASIAMHPKNEGSKTYSQVLFDKKMGMNPGASDIIIPSSPGFCMELKRANRIKAKFPKAQIKYLLDAQKHGSFACIALGCTGAKMAFEHYLKITDKW